MKKTYTMIALIILIGSMAVAAEAQTSGRRQLLANIPFQFGVGDKILPAGEYTVIQVNPVSDYTVLQLRSRDGSATAMVRMFSVIGRAEETAKLIFHRYGYKYFFAEAWTNGETYGFQAPKSRAERAAQKELATIGPQTESIAVRNR